MLLRSHQTFQRGAVVLPAWTTLRGSCARQDTSTTMPGCGSPLGSSTSAGFVGRPGRAWFLEHLLDGDPASNNLSWQWVASSFSSKPYWFDRENLERLSGGRFCRSCARANDCPFAGDRARLAQRLFPQLPPEVPR